MPRNAERLQPDVCSVATGGYEYSSDHYAPTLQALRAGCHVLCEKPISNEIEHAEEMVRVARKERDAALASTSTIASRPPPASPDSGWTRDDLGDLLFVNVALWIGRPEAFESPYYHLKALNPALH